MGELAFDGECTFDRKEVEQPVDRSEEHLMEGFVGSIREQARIPSDCCEETLNIVSAVEVQRSGNQGCYQRGNTSEGYVFPLLRKP